MTEINPKKPAEDNPNKKSEENKKAFELDMLKGTAAHVNKSKLKPLAGMAYAGEKLLKDIIPELGRRALTALDESAATAETTEKQLAEAAKLAEEGLSKDELAKRRAEEARVAAENAQRQAAQQAAEAEAAQVREENRRKANKAKSQKFSVKKELIEGAKEAAVENMMALVFPPAGYSMKFYNFLKGKKRGKGVIGTLFGFK